MLKAYRFYDSGAEQGVTFFETRNGGNFIRVYTPLDMVAYQGKVGADWSPWTGWVYSNPAVEEYEYTPRLLTLTPQEMGRLICRDKDYLISISTVEDALYVTGVMDFRSFFMEAKRNRERALEKALSEGRYDTRVRAVLL